MIVFLAHHFCLRSTYYFHHLPRPTAHLGESGSVRTIKIGSVNMFYCVSPPAGPAAVFLKDFTDFLSSIIILSTF